MIYEICLSLEIKYCHVVCVGCCRRFHNDSTELPFIAHDVIGRSICHLLSPVTCKEHIVLAIIIAVFILLTVIPWCFRITVSLEIVDLSDYDIISFAISDRKIIRIAILIFYRYHILIQFTYEESCISPSQISVFHTIFISFDPYSRVDIFP